MPQLHETTTLEAFEALPDEPWRAELVGGIIVREPPAGFEHGRIAARLTALLDQHVRERGTGVVWGPRRGLCSRKTHRPSVRPMSLSLRSNESPYLAAGCRLVWVVDPHVRSVTTYESPGSIRLLREDETLDGGPVIPELTIPLEFLFGS